MTEKKILKKKTKKRLMDGRSRIKGKGELKEVKRKRKKAEKEGITAKVMGTIR